MKIFIIPLVFPISLLVPKFHLNLGTNVGEKFHFAVWRGERQGANKSQSDGHNIPPEDCWNEACPEGTKCL